METSLLAHRRFAIRSTCSPNQSGNQRSTYQPSEFAKTLPHHLALVAALLDRSSSPRDRDRQARFLSLFFDAKKSSGCRKAGQCKQNTSKVVVAACGQGPTSAWVALFGQPKLHHFRRVCWPANRIAASHLLLYFFCGAGVPARVERGTRRKISSLGESLVLVFLRRGRRSAADLGNLPPSSAFP